MRSHPWPRLRGRGRTLDNPSRQAALRALLTWALGCALRTCGVSHLGPGLRPEDMRGHAGLLHRPRTSAAWAPQPPAYAGEPAEPEPFPAPPEEQQPQRPGDDPTRVPTRFDFSPPEVHSPYPDDWHPPEGFGENGPPAYPSHPLRPPYWPSWPSNPRFPVRPPRAPYWPSRPFFPRWPPWQPPSPQAPPAPQLPLRLAGGARPSEGVVQVYDAASGEWGSFCLPEKRFVFQPAKGDMYDVAKLICRQLGLPWFAARLVHPGTLGPNGTAAAQGARAKVLAPTQDWNCGMCPVADRLASVFDCERVLVLDELAPHCNAAAVDSAGYGRRNLCGNWSRVPGTSWSTSPHVVSTAFRGRPEVLMPGPGGGQPVWGTVCAGVAWPPDALLRYACRAAGLPWRNPWWTLGRSTPRLAPPSVPMHWLYAEACELTPQGLACGLVAEPQQAAELLNASRIAAGSSEYSGSSGSSGSGAGCVDLGPVAAKFLQLALEKCDVRARRGHVYDTVVTCRPDAPAWPALQPPPPPAPPSQPLPILNDVQVRGTEVFDNVYAMVELGVRPSASADPVWGTVVREPVFEEAPRGLARSAAAAICAQLTAGRRTYGYWARLGVDYGTRGWGRGFPTLAEWRGVPVVAHDVDCRGWGAGVRFDQQPDDPWLKLPPEGWAPNITMCRVTPARPFPAGGINLDSDVNVWSNRLLACSVVECGRDFADVDTVLSLRLAGGGNSSWGRLEVLLQRLGYENFGFGSVCAHGFRLEQAQAVCRDLGLGWTDARILPTTAVPTANGSVPIGMDGFECKPAPATRLSFQRDCKQPFRGDSLPYCGHDTDVVMACGGESPPLDYPSPSPSRPPGYGASPGPSPSPSYGSAPPAYGSTSSPAQPPPMYGTR
ncbi:hypothetical protein HYH03_010861 [Edaphochlamys debaryana]|uniref:SRCR domain-containing protein n=1 Tax=Edaphochlamys debaryana TaxID=47281 RepID=A0A835Y197_9CHLO|nr:hypothetical protein HYH03_010861 [Edaphochlamys debaryana]|eukprot:KAG2490700.1 hypothetical protein HYH03_010861 [Edaphochlamys debaryana]